MAHFRTFHFPQLIHNWLAHLPIFENGFPAEARNWTYLWVFSRHCPLEIRPLSRRQVLPWSQASKKIESSTKSSGRQWMVEMKSWWFWPASGEKWGRLPNFLSSWQMLPRQWQPILGLAWTTLQLWAKELILVQMRRKRQRLGWLRWQKLRLHLTLFQWNLLECQRWHNPLIPNRTHSTQSWSKSSKWSFQRCRSGEFQTINYTDNFTKST